MNQIEYRPLQREELLPDLLLQFDRRQEVTHTYRWRGKRLVCRRNPHIADWDTKRKQDIVSGFADALDSGGAVFAAFDRNQLIGFTSVPGGFIGGQGQFLQLKMLLVSREHRHLGIGKALFALAAQAARALGAQKLYVSANSAKESQLFYRAVGCVPASEVIPELFELEPYDIHMEYDLHQL